jgi:hypothetical protein
MYVIWSGEIWSREIWSKEPHPRPLHFVERVILFSSYTLTVQKQPFTMMRVISPLLAKRGGE